MCPHDMEMYEMHQYTVDGADTNGYREISPDFDTGGGSKRSS